MDNLTLVAILFVFLWVSVFAFYFYLTRQQADLEGEIDAVQALLDEEFVEERA